MKRNPVARFEVKGKTVVFRHPVWKDVDPFMEYMNGVYRESLEQPVWMPAAEIDRDKACDRVSALLKREALGRSHHLMVDVDGQLAGQGWIDMPTGQFGEGYATLGINLARAARRMGIGTRLMVMLEEEARRRKLHGIILDVADANPAMKLYEKCGFKEIGRRPHYISSNAGKEPFEKRPDLVQMLKKLD